MTEFRIKVVVEPDKATAGIDKTRRGLNSLEKTSERLRRSLARAFALVGIGVAIRELVRMADALTNAQNRIRLVTSSTKQLNAVTKQLFAISAATRTSFEATATIYSRTALAVKDLGLTQREVLNFTTSLNQAIVLSGVSAQEANAGLIQLSQGLASGTLRGDELRSVLEQLPKVADVIAKEMKVTRGELRLLGQEGMISAENVISAFVTASDELKAAFADSIPTISQGFAVLRSRFIEFIGEVDRSSRISEKFARSLIFMAENLDTIAKFAVIAGGALAGPFVKQGVMIAIVAVKALTVAILANPIGFLVIAIGAGIAALIQFGDQITVSADGVLNLQDVIEGTFQFLMEAITPVTDALTEGFRTAINFITKAFGSINLTMEDVIIFAKKFVNNFIGLYVGLGRAVSSVFNDLGEIINSVMGKDFLDKLANGVKAVFDFVVKGLKVIASFAAVIFKVVGGIAKVVSDEIAGLKIPVPEVDSSFAGNMVRVGDNAKKAFLEGFDQDFVGLIGGIISPAIRQIEENARKIAAKRKLARKAEIDGELDVRPERVDRLPFALREQLRVLEAEAKTLKLSNRERGIQNELLKLEEKLRTSNTSLTESQRDLLESRIRLNTALREQADIVDSIRQPHEELASRQENLNILYREGAISLGQFNEQMIQLALAQSELNITQGEGSFFDGFLIGIESMLEAVRNFRSEAGGEFASFFSATSDGFGKAIGDAIVFGDSLRNAIGNVAAQAVSSLIAGLVKLGVQYMLNATLGQGLAVAATASGVAQAGILSTAFATPAALASLASFGANSLPANAGIAATIAFAQSAATVPFKDGGFVNGAGSGTSDSINARLSNGEFVVNAKSTARFRPQLEAINDPRSSDSTSMSQAPQAGSMSPQGSGDIKIINVIDPNMVEDFMTSSNGEKVIINMIERNASSINQVLRNN